MYEHKQHEAARRNECKTRNPTPCKSVFNKQCHCHLDCSPVACRSISPVENPVVTAFPSQATHPEASCSSIRRFRRATCTCGGWAVGRLGPQEAKAPEVANLLQRNFLHHQNSIRVQRICLGLRPVSTVNNNSIGDPKDSQTSRKAPLCQFGYGSKPRTPSEHPNPH